MSRLWHAHTHGYHYIVRAESREEVLKLTKFAGLSPGIQLMLEINEIPDDGSSRVLIEWDVVTRRVGK